MQASRLKNERPPGALVLCRLSGDCLRHDRSHGLEGGMASQDLMFPFARPVETVGFELPTKNYARPPREVLKSLVAVRPHLDEHFASYITRACRLPSHGVGRWDRPA